MRNGILVFSLGNEQNRLGKEQVSFGKQAWREDCHQKFDVGEIFMQQSKNVPKIIYGDN